MGLKLHFNTYCEVLQQLKKKKKKAQLVFRSFAVIEWKTELIPSGSSLLFSCLTYDDGAGAQQPDLLLQSYSVGDFLLLLLAVRHGTVWPGADAAAAVLSIHVRLPGSGPVRPIHCVHPVSVLPVLLSSPHSVFMQTEWAALAQQPAAVQGRMLNTLDSPWCVQGHWEEQTYCSSLWMILHLFIFQMQHDKWW